jgi:hypothetical protein
MSDKKHILTLFVNMVKAGKDFTISGIEKAFQAFCLSLEEKNIKPPPRAVNPDTYVATAFEDAVAAAAKPVKIPYFVNAYGNKESTIIAGMILAEDEIGVYAAGVQDGANIVPLTMREVTACKGNGFRYKGSNTSGSAQFTTDSNRI